MKAIIAYGDGYSVCDNCRKPFRLDHIRKPPLEAFHRDLAGFVGMDEARVMPGARRGFQAVADTYVEKGAPVLLTALSHYTEFLAIEAAGGVPREIPKDEKNIITADAASSRIEEVTREFGRPPCLLFIDHFDYQFGNEHEVREIARVARAYDVKVMYNGAYTVGILPVDGKELGVDFVVGSGHKSMASPAPSGLLATTKEHAQEPLPDDPGERGYHGQVVRREGGGAPRVHSHGCDHHGDDGLLPPCQGTGEPVAGGTHEREDSHRCSSFHRGDHHPLRVPTEAHPDAGGYPQILRPCCRNPQEKGVFLHERPHREGDRGGHPGGDAGMEVQYLRSHEAAGGVPGLGIQGHCPGERYTGYLILPGDREGEIISYLRTFLALPKHSNASSCRFSLMSVFPFAIHAWQDFGSIFNAME